MLKYIKEADSYRKMAPKVNIEKYIAKDIKWNAKNNYTSVDYRLYAEGDSKGAYNFVRENASDFESKGFKLEWIHDKYDTDRKFDSVNLSW